MKRTIEHVHQKPFDVHRSDRTRAYVTRRNPNSEYKADLDIIRRLKRYIAREVYPILIDALSTPHQDTPQAA